MNNTSFTVIMPVYNTSKEYLSESVESVLNLDYDNYEFILIDDGSTNEETIQLLSRYEDKCMIVHQENKGISASRLVGLSKATKDYIVFLDSDDHIDEKGLKVLDEIIRNNHPDVVMYDPPRYLKDYRKTEFRNKFLKEGIVSKDEILKQLCLLHINCIGDKFVKRELYEGMENEIDTSFINGEDLQQSTFIVLKAETFYYTDYPIEYYRYNLNQREYYDATRLNDINFTVPTYRMLFEKNNQYNHLLGTYKTAAVNYVVYNAFKICKVKLPFKERKRILDELNQQEIVKVLSGIKEKLPAVSSILFSLLTGKRYYLLTAAATLYNRIYGLDNLY